MGLSGALQGRQTVRNNHKPSHVVDGVTDDSYRVCLSARGVGIRGQEVIRQLDQTDGLFQTFRVSVLGQLGGRGKMGGGAISD